jgi:hypothetical protein
MKIKSQKDFWSGLMFMGVGIAFAWGATNYTIGEGARMGPGYFPLVLGILLTIIGVFITFEALVVETEDGEPVGKFAWKPLFFIIGSNLIFGILLAGLPKLGIPAMGLIVAILRAHLRGQPGRRGAQEQGGGGAGHGARPRQLPRLHRAAETAVPGLAQLHQRLRGDTNWI